MKQIKSEKYPNLVLTLDEGKFLCFVDEDDKENGLYENDEAVYEMYRIFKLADEEGAFDHLGNNGEMIDCEVIYVKRIEK